jgi:hypothetical protein
VDIMDSPVVHVVHFVHKGWFELGCSSSNHCGTGFVALHSCVWYLPANCIRMELQDHD